MIFPKKKVRITERVGRPTHAKVMLAQPGFLSKWIRIKGRLIGYLPGTVQHPVANSIVNSILFKR